MGATPNAAPPGAPPPTIEAGSPQHVQDVADAILAGVGSPPPGAPVPAAAPDQPLIPGQPVPAEPAAPAPEPAIPDTGTAAVPPEQLAGTPAAAPAAEPAPEPAAEPPAEGLPPEDLDVAEEMAIFAGEKDEPELTDPAAIEREQAAQESVERAYKLDEGDENRNEAMWKGTRATRKGRRMEYLAKHFRDKIVPAFGGEIPEPARVKQMVRDSQIVEYLTGEHTIHGTSEERQQAWRFILAPTDGAGQRRDTTALKETALEIIPALHNIPEIGKDLAVAVQKQALTGFMETLYDEASQAAPVQGQPNFALNAAEYLNWALHGDNFQSRMPAPAPDGSTVQPQANGYRPNGAPPMNPEVEQELNTLRQQVSQFREEHSSTQNQALTSEFDTAARQQIEQLLTNWTPAPMVKELVIEKYLGQVNEALEADPNYRGEMDLARRPLLRPGADPSSRRQAVKRHQQRVGVVARELWPQIRRGLIQDNADTTAQQQAETQKRWQASQQMKAPTGAGRPAPQLTAQPQGQQERSGPRPGQDMESYVNEEFQNALRSRGLLAAG